MHQFNRIAVLNLGLGEPWATNDLPIELHHNHPRVEFELAQEIGESRRTLDDPWVAVHG